MGRDAQKERAARNEALFREVNERIGELADEGEWDSVDVICECSGPECTETLTMARGDYEAVRKHPARFIVRPAHESHDVEQIVERQASFLVVEKLSDAREVAEALDPRA